MGVDVEVLRAQPHDRLPLARMLELYQHDLSDIWNQDLDDHGEYGWPLDRYWLDARCHPFVARVNGHYAGFALVDWAVRVGPQGHWIDQFFVVRKYRGRGVGRAMAHAVFAALPGPWEVGQLRRNAGAQAFWRAVIGGWRSGHYTEHSIKDDRWDGPVQCFRT